MTNSTMTKHIYLQEAQELNLIFSAIINNSRVNQNEP